MTEDTLLNPEGAVQVYHEMQGMSWFSQVPRLTCFQEQVGWGT